MTVEHVEIERRAASRTITAYMLFTLISSIVAVSMAIVQGIF